MMVTSGSLLHAAATQRNASCISPVGGGYGLSGVLQRATKWNIPLAFGVGLGWGDFVEFGQEAQEYLLLVSRRMTLFINILPHSKTLRSPSAKDIQLVVVN